MIRYPFIPFTIGFVVGIILGKLYILEDLVYLYLAAISILIFIFIQLYFIIFKNIRKINIPVFIFTIIFGALYFVLFNTQKPEYPFHKARLKNVIVYGKIKSIDLIKNDRIEFILAVDSVKTPGSLYKTGFNALCKISDESFQNINVFYHKLGTGNYLQLRGLLAKPKNVRNPGDFDYAKYLYSKNLSALLYVKGLSNVGIIDTQTGAVKNLIFTIRKTIDGILKKYHTAETYALLRSLLLADRGELDFELKSKYVNAGVVHVLAVSGLHVGFIVLIFMLLFNRFNLYLKYIFTITGVVFFLIITGAQPPVFRASVMAIIIIIALLTNRSTNAYNSLAIAAFLILILNPEELFNPGFQLSFSAVLSIVYFYPEMRKAIYLKFKRDNLVRKFLLFAAVSLSAQIGTLPFTLLYFHKLSLISVIINVFIIPAIGFVLGLGIVVILIGFVSEWLALAYASANCWLVNLMNGIIKSVGSSSYAYLDIHNFSLYDTLLFYLLLFSVLISLTYFRNRKARVILFILAILNFAVFSTFDNNSLLPEHKFNIMIFDAGEGQSVLFNCDQYSLLANAGKRDEFFDFGKRVLQPFFAGNGIEQINLGLLTGVRNELYGGFFTLVKKKHIVRLLKPQPDTLDEEENILEEFFSYHHVKVEYFSDKVYSAGKIKLYPLVYPKPDFLHTKKNGIFIISCGNISVLLIDLIAPQNIYLPEKLLDKLNIKIVILRLKSKILKKVRDFLMDIHPEFLILDFKDRFLPGEESRDFNFPGNKIMVEDVRRNGAVLLSGDGNNIEQIDWRTRY